MILRKRAHGEAMSLLSLAAAKEEVRSRTARLIATDPELAEAVTWTFTSMTLAGATRTQSFTAERPNISDCHHFGFGSSACGSSIVAVFGVMGFALQSRYLGRILGPLS